MPESSTSECSVIGGAYVHVAALSQFDKKPKIRTGFAKMDLLFDEMQELREKFDKAEKEKDEPAARRIMEQILETVEKQKRENRQLTPKKMGPRIRNIVVVIVLLFFSVGLFFGADIPPS